MKASERSEILLSVKGSCPLSRDPRRRGCRVRNSNSLRTGLFLGAFGSHRVLSFPLNLASQAHANRGPREGKSGGLYTPSSMRVKGLRGTLPRPRKSLLDPDGALCQALSPRPTAGPPLLITMVGQEGCVQGHEDGGRSSLPTGPSEGSPSWVEKEPAPQRGAGSCVR